MKLSVLIAAAGKGTRMGMGKNKTLLPVDGVPMLVRSVSVFESMPETDEIIVITGAEDLEETRRLVSEYGFK
ncbi:MAG: 2-C-methyl-D-erythritol 4-phosphate cytidylyltransferase, partial [Abditibacteriota bacterium]|nr:2-C-methyl-D-erythritol 4-phosphate cytidylyltransferase [Abditibacteriota bacterium]